ncbi:MAG: hypothetical protein B1H03_01080 [Planctomycetales bacterium 4484_113]|nr:MAG: hypothetical protein B1H03_01080 [Planctomycetales bacterium 4484_113]
MTPEKENFNMEDCLGRRVRVVLHKEAFGQLQIEGVTSPKFYARVLGFDSIGLWLENPNYRIMPSYDSDGKYIPPEQRKEECHRSAFLLPWPLIQSVIAFPDIEEVTPEEEEELIGFAAVREKQKEINEMRERAAARASKKKKSSKDKSIRG